MQAPASSHSKANCATLLVVSVAALRRLCWPVSVRCELPLLPQFVLIAFAHHFDEMVIPEMHSEQWITAHERAWCNLNIF